MDKQVVVYLLHLIGIFMIFMALGGAVVRVVAKDESKELKRLIGITFGLGMILVIYGGMSLMVLREYAKGGMPSWLVVKLILWFVFAATFSLIIRKPDAAKSMWGAVILLGAIAVYMVYGRPF